MLKSPAIGDAVLKEVRIKPNFVGFTIDIVLQKPIEGEIINDQHHNAE